MVGVRGSAEWLQSQKGKVIVLGLFHICEPCLEQGTNLQKVNEAMQGKNVAVIGVNSSGNSKKDVTEFLSAFPVKVTYPYLLDPKKETDKLYGGGKFIPNRLRDRPERDYPLAAGGEYGPGRSGRDHRGSEQAAGRFERTVTWMRSRPG